MPDGDPPGNRRRPPWWPDDEPWPPRPAWGGRRHRPYGPWGAGAWHADPPWNDAAWRRRRRRRIGCALAVFVVIVVVGVTAVVGFVALLLGLAGIGGAVHPEAIVVAVLVAGVLFAALSRAARRFATPVDELLDAADRLAEGDYAVRVPERGPAELRAAAHALNTLAERLAATEERRRAMLADVSHELRTPLTVVRGGLEGMLDGVHPRDDQHLAALRDETLLLDRLIDDLRTLSLAEVGALPLSRSPESPADLVEDAVAAFRAGAGAAGVALEVDVAAGVPRVDADRVRIAEVLRNLLANALRFTPAGGSVTVSAALGPAAMVTFSVRDTGTGLAPGEAAHIFDRYRRAADAGGSGLGLSIARELVAAHGGTIDATSDGPGLGTVVRFSLPLAR